MHPLLSYPFDASLLLKKRKSIKKELLESDTVFITKKIAILGGSTTHDIKDMLELFLLNNGINAEFYESDYGKYWEDGIFENPKLESFKPDIIYIHTSNRNISQYPKIKDSCKIIDASLSKEFSHFSQLWDSLMEKYTCPIIQNNFEMPFYRLLGNKDASDIHGRINYIQRLNSLIYTYAQEHKNFFINDINYLSASYGLEDWANPLYWYMYKYSLCISAIPVLSFNISNIIKSIFGKNKKALVLDLDNTLWGGVIGDDGIEGIELGHETPTGQLYSEFQEYLKSIKELGVLLNINSKNNKENAIAGLKHPEGTLRPDDFIVIKSNWENKDQNIIDIANELNILTDSLVFVDDNPVERNIISENIPNIAVPALSNPEQYITIIDRSGFFEMTVISDDDLNRNEMYKANIERTQLEQKYANYEDYLKSLNMVAIIKNFDPIYLQRITQLTNKTNQFNLTTKRFTDSEISMIANDSNHICLYGKLQDKFGDNGLVTVIIGRKDEDVLHIDVWLMSCRVLKRDMECAMLDVLVSKCKKSKIKTIRGYYKPTAKNGMVKEHYQNMGFTKIKDENGETIWELMVETYNCKNTTINIIEKNEDKDES